MGRAEVEKSMVFLVILNGAGPVRRVSMLTGWMVMVVMVAAILFLFTFALLYVDSV